MARLSDDLICHISTLCNDKSYNLLLQTREHNYYLLKDKNYIYYKECMTKYSEYEENIIDVFTNSNRSWKEILQMLKKYMNSNINNNIMRTPYEIIEIKKDR